MPWQQLTLCCPHNRADFFADVLQELGAVSVTFMDNEDVPNFEEHLGEIKLWPKTKVLGLFELEINLENIYFALQNVLQDETEIQLSFNPIEDKDWQNAWKEHFKPLQFGNLWVIPSWHWTDDSPTCSVKLDPGMAFGTGTHPTTQLMLEWLASLDLSDKTVLDYGCGSGILAIAAAKLGAKKVVAVDNDPGAVKVTQDNAILNEVSMQQLETYLDTDFNETEPYDIVVANILANPLTILAPKLTDLTRDSGYIALAGLLETQTEQVRSCYQAHFNFQADKIREGWARLVGQRQVIQKTEGLHV